MGLRPHPILFYESPAGVECLLKFSKHHFIIGVPKFRAVVKNFRGWLSQRQHLDVAFLIGGRMFVLGCRLGLKVGGFRASAKMRLADYF